MKAIIGESRKMMKASNAMRELQINKLIFRHKGDYNNYYVNPLIAWKGDRTAYFNPETLPFSWNA
ncbi:hypothetical protein [Dyadobacter sp. BHUBP1]|uniref:hypothetical protein n=1 Tax=Dyadobacter sp. BHUBP1 TaxID=3424178 RepID=UPI003D33E71A